MTGQRHIYLYFTFILNNSFHYLTDKYQYILHGGMNSKICCLHTFLKCLCLCELDSLIVQMELINKGPGSKFQKLAQFFGQLVQLSCAESLRQIMKQELGLSLYSNLA